MTSLHEIAVRHSPSKLDHGYDKTIYPRYLEDMRNENLTLLEIGVRDGNSLTMWEEYFPNATIIGIDKEHRWGNKLDGHGRIHTFIGRQEDTKFLSEVVNQTGRPDIVVDDGSHMGEHQTASFQFLFPELNKKGKYFVEDTFMGMPKEQKFVQYMKHLSDWMSLGHKLNVKLTAPEHDHLIGKNISGIHFYPKIIVVEKR